MPIKFRCQHCRQFLGISRAQASCVVDCPTCGRTIRVPDLDGRVKALPKPKIDAQDSALVKALDAVAAIGSSNAEEIVDDDSDFEEHSEERLSPDKYEIEAIELEPLPAPEPVELDPVSEPSRPNKPADGHWKSTAAPGEDWKQLMAAAQLGEGEQEDTEKASAAVEQELARDNQAPAQIHRPIPTDQGQPAPRLNATTMFAMIGVAAMIFAGGFWLGRITTVEGPATTSNKNNGDSTNPAGDNAGNDVEFDDLETAIRGRITYRAEGGQRLPDREARVIVLPADWEGAGKLPSAGFQNGAAIQDRRIAIAAIREMGGDFCMTDEEGAFSIKLKSSGQFQVLVLSNSLSREAGDDDDTVEQLAAKYFDRSSQLLGRIKYHVEKVRYSGDGTEPFDHSFQRI
jgi:hypothetical protein